MQNEMRDRLIELVKHVPYGVSVGATFEQYFCETVADHLIAHGVTFKDVPDTNVGEWISVEDRLPNCKKVVDGETYFKNVAVRVKGCGFEKIAFYDDEEMHWFDTNFLPAVGEVTHWCELPEWYLPQPPKGE